MELKGHLATQLRQLRLSGVMETLEARNRQAIDDQWSFVEFLSRLLEDEIERRAQKQLRLRLRRASLNTTKTLEGFDFNFNPNINRQQVLALASTCCAFICASSSETVEICSRSANCCIFRLWT
jgi:DNA replication protein DnaC